MSKWPKSRHKVLFQIGGSSLSREQISRGSSSPLPTPPPKLGPQKCSLQFLMAYHCFSPPWSSKWNVLTSTAMIHDSIHESRTALKSCIHQAGVQPFNGMTPPPVFLNGLFRSDLKTSVRIAGVDDAVWHTIQEAVMHSKSMCKGLHIWDFASYFLFPCLLGGICMFFANSERIEDHYRLQDFFW